MVVDQVSPIIVTAQAAIRRPPNHEEKSLTVRATLFHPIGAGFLDHQQKSKEVQIDPFAACKRKDVMEPQEQGGSAPKKPRLVFTDLQRRTLQAIFKETKRPSKEMQVTIARQLGLEPTTVGNFFMNARRRSHDKWRDGPETDSGLEMDDDMNCGEPGANVKYEVYDSDMDQHYQEYQDNEMHMVGQDPLYPPMTAIPGPVHNSGQLQHHYPSTCS